MLQAGFARVDITPPLGTELSGYFHVRYAETVMDPIYANALALAYEDTRAVIVAVDFIGMQKKFTDQIRADIASRTGLEKENIYVAALHQHTSCSLAEGGHFPITDDGVRKVAMRKMADAAVMALKDLAEAELFAAARETDVPVGFVRRYFDKNGNVHTNPHNVPDIVSRCAEADNTARCVRFVRKGKKDILLANFSTHPDVVSGARFSADWPGFVRTYAEQAMDVHCIFLLGCQGDSNHVDFFLPADQRLKGGKRYKHAMYMGRTVADALVKAQSELVPLQAGPIRGQYRVLYNLTNTEGLERYDELLAWHNKNIKGELGYQPHITELAFTNRILRLRNEPIFHPVPLSAITMGDLVLFGFGGEAFTSYGQHVRDIAPEKFVVCSVCTNGYQGYFPSEEAFAQGGYETAGSFFTPTLEQEIVAAAKEMLA